METQELKEFCLSNTHAKVLLERAGIKVSRSQVRKILEEGWNLKQYPNASNFKAYLYDHSGYLLEMDMKGRYYKILREDLEHIYHGMLTI